MHIWIIGCACLCESSPFNSQSCILDPISCHEQPTWPNTFLPPRSRTWLIFVFLTVGRRAFVQSDYLTIRAALISLASHSLTTLPSGGHVAEETCAKALHDGQFWLLFSPLTPVFISTCPTPPIPSLLSCLLPSWSAPAQNSRVSRYWPVRPAQTGSIHRFPSTSLKKKLTAAWPMTTSCSGRSLMYGTLGHTASDHIPTLGFTLNTYSCRLAQVHPVIPVVQGELLYECTEKLWCSHFLMC